MVGGELHHPVAHAHLVGIRLAGQRGGGEALADLDALHRVDRHQRRGDLGIELAVDRRAQAGRDAFGHHLDHRAGRGTGLAHLGQVALPTASRSAGSGQKNGLSSTASQSQRARSMRCGPICTSAPRMRTAVAQHLARHAAGGDAHRGLARRGPAAAAIVADAVFQLVGQVGVAWPELRGDRRVVARALVDVVDLHGDRRAGGQALEHAGQDADLVRLLALRGEARLAGAAAVEPGLDVGLGQRDARRAAVDHAADRRPVAFAPGGDAEQMAEAVMRHRRMVSRIAPPPAPSRKGRGSDGIAPPPLAGGGWGEGAVRLMSPLDDARCRARPGSSCRRYGSRNRRDAPRRSRPTDRSDSR